MMGGRRRRPRSALRHRLIEAEVDGERLSQQEILGFFQLLIVGGQETTTNLINNAVLCLLEHPDQLARLRKAPELLPSAVEEFCKRLMNTNGQQHWVLSAESGANRRSDQARERVQRCGSHSSSRVT